MSKELIERLRRDKYDSLKNLAADRIEELEREVADALDCRSGTGPTALSMVLAERDQLREHVKMLRDALECCKQLAGYPEDVFKVSKEALAATEQNP